MIAEQYLVSVKDKISWQRDAMIEQDMIISRALVSLYNNPIIRKHLLFRGGTALNKLFLSPAARYSEDIDFVLVQEQPVGFLMDAIKDSLQWLGKARTTRDEFGFKVVYIYENIEGGKSKLKIETNAVENFKFNPLQEIPFSFESDWFSGNTSIITYDIEELMATKLRALYQRRKGRDLFDVWYAFSKGFADIRRVTEIFHAYNTYNNIKITPKQFVENMEKKREHKDFRLDIRALLPLDTDYDFNTAFEFVMREVVPAL